MSKRNVNIRRSWNKYIGKMWTCEVTDSYGITHVNHFETTEEASKWTYYIWENEDAKVDSDELMSNAIAECVQMDIDRGVEPSLD